MTINPFVAGVIVTLFVEMAGLFIWAIWNYRIGK